jgi:peptide-methionine (S)-S-oxide reductase
MSIFVKIILVISVIALIACSRIVNSSTATADATELAATPMNQAHSSNQVQTAVFAGGCFWGVEAVFEHVKGVTNVVSGYAGGDAKAPSYKKVSEGNTGYAESVKVTFDPSKVTYVQLLSVFFSVAHDPTQLNRQGPDTGSQYRSAIFYQSDEQRAAALSYIEGIDKSKALPKAVVTQVVPLKEFYEAESYHQDYLKNHPTDPYIVYNDLPKLAVLKEKFPDLYKEN